jgi:hypothetical protein
LTTRQIAGNLSFSKAFSILGSGRPSHGLDRFIVHRDDTLQQKKSISVMVVMQGVKQVDEMLHPSHVTHWSV